MMILSLDLDIPSVTKSVTIDDSIGGRKIVRKIEKGLQEKAC